MTAGDGLILKLVFHHFFSYISRTYELIHIKVSQIKTHVFKAHIVLSITEYQGISQMFKCDSSNTNEII